MSPEQDPTVRFDGREDDYDRYRPGIRWDSAFVAGEGHPLERHRDRRHRVRDRLLTAMLLRQGAKVYAVEPNARMRAKAETRFKDEPNFVSVPAGPRHWTTDGGVDLVIRRPVLPLVRAGELPARVQEGPSPGGRSCWSGKTDWTTEGFQHRL